MGKRIALSKKTIAEKKLDAERMYRKKILRALLKEASQKLRKEAGVSGKTVRVITALYKKTGKRQLAPANRSNMLCAIILLGSQTAGQPVTIKEAQRAMGINQQMGCYLEKKIRKNVRLLKEELKIQTVVAGPNLYISRFCRKIGLDGKIAAKAEKIAEIELKRTTPVSKAVAAINIATEQKISIIKLAKTIGVTETTIRVKTRELNKKLTLSFFY